MYVTLTRPYLGNLSGTTIAVPDDVGTAMTTQGLATAATGQPAGTYTESLYAQLAPATLGGNSASVNGQFLAPPTNIECPAILPNGPILAFASLGTNTTLVSGTLYRAEIWVPTTSVWKGIGVLNGATVGTNNGLVALYDTTGALIGNSAVAGAVTVGANSFQNRDFLAKTLLVRGRYFIAYQANGTTDTLRTWAAANGGNQMTASSTGTFGTLPNFTPPTTFTADVGPIGWLYQ